MNEGSEAWRTVHQELAGRLAAFAEAFGRAGALRAEDLAGLQMFLRGVLLPHAEAEERELYPKLDAVIAAHGRPTATMRLDHEFIRDYVRRIEMEVAAAAEVRDTLIRGMLEDRVRDLLTGLRAVVAAHLDKEDRVYLPLLERHLPAAERQALLDRVTGTPIAPV